MRRARGWIVRLAGLFNKQLKDHELDEELESHVQMHIEDNVRSGMTPEEARREAVIKLGGLESTKEAYRDQRGLPLLETLCQDIRYAARMLRKNPGFAAVAVLTLALGIGANTAIFSIVHALLLRPLPYPDGDRIVRISAAQRQKNADHLPLSAPDFVDLEKENRVFEATAAYRGWPFIITGSGEPVKVFGQRISAGFFRVLGVKPMLGRAFLPDEDQHGNDNVVILSYQLWQSRYGGATNVIGSALNINDTTRTVVGVMPPDFSFQSLENALWVPIAFGPEDLNRNLDNLSVIGRLRSGVSLQQAQSAMAIFTDQLEQQYPEDRGKGSSVVSLREDTVGKVRSSLIMLLGAVGFVLLIACLNVANLQLNRALGRRREFAIRSALGALRWRLVGQLLSENLLLALIGGALALLLAFLGLESCQRLIADQMPQIQEATIDHAVVGFALLVSALAGATFCLVPAFQASRFNLTESLKAGGDASAGPPRQRLRSALVVTEVALALMLLAAAGLLMRSFLRLRAVDTGFQTENLLTMETFLPPARYQKPEQQRAFFQQVIRRLGTVPGVQSVGASIGLPFTDASIFFSFTIEGQSSPSDGQLIASYRAISPNYFRTMGIPLLVGRDFSEQDHAQAPGVVIVNRSFARRYFQGEDPLGKQIDIGDGYNKPREIVGVVADAKSKTLTASATPEMYVVYLQRPWSWLRYAVHASIAPETLTSAVRKAVWSVDKDIPVTELKTMDRLISQTVTEPRFYLVLLSLFAGIALLLAALGIYGVVAYSVKQRTQEIGIRMALGAQRTVVLGLVVRQGMKLVFCGVVLGMLGALATTRLLTKLLFGVSATDPATFAGMSLLLGFVALLACYLPARRAAKVNPMVALRYE